MDTVNIKEFRPVEPDDMNEYLNERAVINVSWTNKPIFGKVSEIGPSFLTIERRDGRRIKIRRAAIMGIERQRAEAV